MKTSLKADVLQFVHKTKSKPQNVREIAKKMKVDVEFVKRALIALVRDKKVFKYWKLDDKFPIYSTEKDLFPDERTVLIQNVFSLIQTKRGLTRREIANELTITIERVRSVVARLEADGKINVVTVNGTATYVEAFGSPGFGRGAITSQYDKYILPIIHQRSHSVAHSAQ